jgi:hypothetical protein
MKYSPISKLVTIIYRQAQEFCKCNCSLYECLLLITALTTVGCFAEWKRGGGEAALHQDGGLHEFSNEVVLITGMKHRNLVDVVFANTKGCWFTSTWITTMSTKFYLVHGSSCSSR